jgi:hypothetical protein
MPQLAERLGLELADTLARYGKCLATCSIVCSLPSSRPNGILMIFSSRGVNIFKAEDSCPCRLQRRRRLCTKSAGQLAMEKTVASPPWKTLRLSHFSPATTAAVHPYPKIRRETCSETKGLHKGYDVNSLTRTGTKSRSGQV